MSKLLKEVHFDIMKSTEVDLSPPVIPKKQRKKRNDDYDYDDDFLEAFEGESEPIEMDCSLNNFFVFQGPLPFSTKKVLNFFKNKPNLQIENDNELQILEDALCTRKKRKASPTLVSDFPEEVVVAKPKKGRRAKVEKEYTYKDPVIAYLHGKFVKLLDNVENLSVDERIWVFLTNYILYIEYDGETYKNNLEVLIERRKKKKEIINEETKKDEDTKNDEETNKDDEETNKDEDTKKDDETKKEETKNEETKIDENKNDDKIEENKNENKKDVNSDSVVDENKKDCTTNSLTTSFEVTSPQESSSPTKPSPKNPSTPLEASIFDYTSPSSFLPPDSFVPSVRPSSIDGPLYSCISKYFKDEEIEKFISNMITKIDNALVSITVTASNETMYDPTNRKFLGFNEQSFRTDCIIYFTNYVVKHYASNTSYDIMHYYHEAKKSVMDVFLECSNKTKTLFYVNGQYRNLIDNNIYDY